MPSPAWTFTEKNFYLSEFRGRSLAIALPEAQLDSMAGLQQVLSDLSTNGTRIVLMSQHENVLSKLAEEVVSQAGASSTSEGPEGSKPAVAAASDVRTDEGEAGDWAENSEWVGRLWRAFRRKAVVGLAFDPGAFPGQCLEAVLRLRLAKLVWLDPRGGLAREDGTRLSVVDLSDLEALLGAFGDTGAEPFSGGLPLLRAIREMVVGGLPAVNLCSPDGLADELFTYAGSGTFFTRERYAEVRRLALDEFDAAADLMVRGVEEGFLVARSAEAVDRALAFGFGVFIEGRYLAGIGSLLPHAAAAAGEVSALYTLTRYVGEGVGSHLIRFALEFAERESHQYVFACTTSERVERFFVRHGFRRVSETEIPAEKWDGYGSDRREQIRCLRRDL